jgi:4-amino-4-deoxy-L-arabinose transferase-like glycosyltransferase
MLLALALVVRGVVGISSASEYYYGAMSFKAADAALNILEHRGAVYQEGQVVAEQHKQNRLLGISQYQNLLVGPFHPYNQHPPGYPYFLAACFSIHKSFSSARVLQIVADSACVLLLVLMLRPTGSLAACLAGLLYALNLELARNSVAILPDSLLPVCLLCATALLWKAARDCADWLLLIAVAPLLAASYLRSEVFLLCPFWMFAFIVARGVTKRRLVFACLASIIFLIGLAPLALRNQYLDKRRSPTTSNGGFVLFAGLGELKNTYGYVVEDTDIDAILAREHMVRNTVESSSYLTQQYFLAWRSHPGYVIKTICARYLRMLVQCGSLGINATFVPYYAKLWRLLVMAAALAFLLFSAQLWRGHVLLIAPVVYYFGVFFFMHFEPRYGFAILHIYCIYAALGTSLLVRTWTTLKQKAAAILETTPIADLSKQRQ